MTNRGLMGFLPNQSRTRTSKTPCYDFYWNYWGKNGYVQWMSRDLVKTASTRRNPRARELGWETEKARSRPHAAVRTPLCLQLLPPCNYLFTCSNIFPFCGLQLVQSGFLSLSSRRFLTILGGRRRIFRRK